MLDKKLIRRKLRGYVAEDECYIVARSIVRDFPEYHLDEGFHLNNYGEWVDHTWVVTRSGTIIDTTYSQFNPKIKVGIWPKGSRGHKQYLSWRDFQRISLEHELGSIGPNNFKKAKEYYSGKRKIC